MAPVNPLTSDDDDRWLDPPAPWWLRVCDVYDRTALSLFDAAGPSAFEVFSRWGRMAHRLVPTPSAADVAAIFPALEPARALSVARESAALRFRNRGAIAIVLRRGVPALASLVATEQPTAPAVLAPQPCGVIVAAFHVGAQFGVGAALHRWGIDALRLRDMPLEAAEDRARTLKRAVDALRSGATVLAAVDGPGGASTAPVEVLGRRIVLRRGPFMLARVSGAAMVPALARWRTDGHIEISLGPRLEPGPRHEGRATEQRLAADAARWLDDHLASHPADLWPYTLRNLLVAPES